MEEEKTGVQNGTPNSEMAPQEEDSSKMPLTEGVDAPVEIAKTSDTKINIPSEEFKGLTKSELMQYAKEPFWVRLRIVLMAFFWIGWVAMLALAIYIIIDAPRCEPPPVISWLQESPMLEVDVTKKILPQESVSLMASLGLTSLYMPALISSHDYYKLNPDLASEQIIAMLTAVTVGAGNKAVTDFVPSPVKNYHNWLEDPNMRDFFTATSTIDYSNNSTETRLEKVFRFWKSDYNVTGFLVPMEEVINNENMHNLTVRLNSELEDEDIVIGEATVDTADTLNNLDVSGKFKQFVQDTVSNQDWTFFKQDLGAAQTLRFPKQIPAVTLALMLLPGTPVFKVSSGNVTAELSSVIKECIDIRSKDAIKFGSTEFVNTTSEDVIGYTRILKGTPGYAVAINLGAEESVIDFTTVKQVPDDASGTLDYIISSLDSKPDGVVPLNNVKIEGHSGMVVQFVAKHE